MVKTDLAVEDLADRLRQVLANRDGIREQRMFGGIAFMRDGNMLCGPMKGGKLMVRVGKAAAGEALARPGAGPMKLTGREMAGFVEVTGDVLEDDETLAAWIALADAFVSTLPPK